MSDIILHQNLLVNSILWLLKILVTLTTSYFENSSDLPTIDCSKKMNTQKQTRNLL